MSRKPPNDHSEKWAKPNLPINLSLAHWAAIIEAIEGSPVNSVEIAEAYIKVRDHYDRAMKYREGLPAP